MAVEGVPAVTSDTKTYTPSMADVGKYLRATATYTDGQGEDKPAQAVSANMVAMKDYVNTAPVFPDQDPETVAPETDQTREIYENMAPGTDVGDPVTATDIGADGSQEVLIYTLGDDTNDNSGDAGLVRHRQGDGPDQCGRRIGDAGLTRMQATPTTTYEVTVTATDPSVTASDPVTVTITVKDVQEAPRVGRAPPRMTIPLLKETTQSSSTRDGLRLLLTQRGTYMATDDEDNNANLEWSLSGADRDKFEIDTATGDTVQLSFKSAPDYEAPY